jgi:hypothetical protein
MDTFDDVTLDLFAQLDDFDIIVLKGLATPG